MAKISSKTLFITTSPRTPEKMIPEIELLAAGFSGMKWNRETQVAFMNLLRESDFFDGQGVKDPAFSARDRITRAPKSLGFVSLQPCISLTPAGHALLTSKRKDEVFLRQMMKFQLPSPYHEPKSDAAVFCVRPYLEMLRLVRTLGTLKFDELHIFGMQLTDYHNFEKIVSKIKDFRAAKAQESHYKKFRKNYLDAELRQIYKERIESGNTKTRESEDRSLMKFLEIQSSNMRDYADACFRYLRATGVVAVSHIGKSLSIVPERIEDVDFLLKSVSREPVRLNSEQEYVAYLGDASRPMLLTDNYDRLTEKMRNNFPEVRIEEGTTIDELKNTLSELLHERKENFIAEQVREIKDYRLYDDIQNTYNDIEERNIYDAPLMLEWNTWRAMTMLDGGEIKANLNFDDFGIPLSTAAGNKADIVCDYGDYMVCVEVTMAGGQKQYEMEGEPVTRHLGKLRTSSGKPCYCLFVAPSINPACVAHFYMLHRVNLAIYGGSLTIVPLPPLAVFRKMLEDSYGADYTPNPSHVRNFFEASNHFAAECNSEVEWYEKITHKALHWLE